MLQEERWDNIYKILQERESATIQFLQKQLFVSEATIRRDLAELEKKGLLVRVWGGAMLRKTTKDVPPFVRVNSNLDKKEKIAATAARFLKNSTSFFFDSSTSCLALVPYLSRLNDITVVTSSLKMSLQLSLNSNASIHLLGGEIYEGYILTGHMAVASCRNYHLNLMFISCSGIDANGNIWSIEPRVVEVNQEMLKHADKRILLCDSTKFGKQFLWHLAEIEDFDYIVSDCEPKDCELNARLGKKLIVWDKNITLSPGETF